MFGATWMGGVGSSTSKVDVHGDSYRLIPSHFPPIGLFENLLDPQELEAAYALESLTNDRLQDEVGNIALVAPEDRVTGPGTTAIMAAFTHAGTESRFTKGLYGVYYAGLDLDTAIEESKFSRSRFLQATNEGPQILTMRCYHCVVDATLADLRGDPKVHDPDSFVHAQAVGERLKQQDALGILYDSIRHTKGECVALLKPKALVPPAVQAGHYQFHWDGKQITNVLSVSELT